MIWVVGAGVIGKYLHNLLEKNGETVKLLSRHVDTNTPGALVFDLNKDLSQLNSIGENRLEKVIFAAGISGIRQCKSKPEESWRLNVDRTAAFLEWTHHRKIDTAFFSSSLIWDIDHSGGQPKSEYARQKTAIENIIRSRFPLVKIVRLGKIISGQTAIIPKFKRGLLLDEEIEVYRNLFVAPVHITSLGEVVLNWVKNPGTNSEINLVPKEQWSERDLFNDTARIMGINTTKVKDVCLQIPRDELPTQVQCPKSIENYEKGAYGPAALIKELGI